MILSSLLAGLLALSPPAEAGRLHTKDDLVKATDLFYDSTALDEAGARTVSGVTLKKDIATFQFESGAFYPTAPLDGVVASGVFLGKGSFTIDPIRPMDKLCLKIASTDNLGKTITAPLKTSFDQMFIATLDGSIGTLLSQASPGDTASGLGQAGSVLHERMQVMSDQEQNFDMLLAAEIAGNPQGAFTAHVHTPDYGWLVFDFDPKDTFEVYLGDIEPIGRFKVPRPLIYTHQSSDLDSTGNYIADPIKDQKNLIDITKYVMEITIPDTQHLLVEADVHFRPLVDGLRAIDFDLVNNIAGVRSDENAKPIHLTAVKDADGNDLPYVHKKHTALVMPPEPLSINNEYVWHFSMDEETIRQLSSVHYRMLNTYPWYPQYGFFGGRAAFDWTIKSKKPLSATGSGVYTEEPSQDGFNVTRLVFDEDVALESLIFGQYENREDHYVPASGGTPVDLRVFSWPTADFYVEDDNGKLQTVEVTVPGNKPKDVLSEAKEIIKFYEQIYGPFPYRHMNVAEMAPGLGFGQAPPGFIQLTGEAFMSTAVLANWTRMNADFFHEFFSHEMAHQYFGHTIQAANIAENWLQESFAEYSAGMYVLGLMGQDRFQGKLKQWRDMARIADPHGPIAWAHNIRGQNAGAYRTGLLYDKGPYVVHMLRMQIGHDNFVKAMTNLFKNHRFQQITTETLQREVEAVVGYKLDYFFEQWYRGVGIPAFDCTTDVRQTEDGKWLATIKMSQRDKQNFKVVLMPVFFHFGGDKVVVQNRPVLGPEDTYQVKLPQKPLKITLDDYKTLLADIYVQGS